MNFLRHFCITGGKKARFLAEKRLDPRLIVCYTSFYLSAGRVYFRARIFFALSGMFREATGRESGQVLQGGAE